MNSEAKTSYHYDDKLLNGVGVIKVAANREQIDPDGISLYQPAQPATDTPVDMTLIPYYAWANRENGQMRVWLNS